MELSGFGGGECLGSVLFIGYGLLFTVRYRYPGFAPGKVQKARIFFLER